jgi:EmrB/QacA subfamily drug resistance transporter
MLALRNDSAYLLGRRRTLIVLSGLLLGMLLAALNQTIVATALPRIVGDLGGFEHYSWVFSAYMLASTVTVPIYGKLSDLYGRRPFFALGIVLFMSGAVVSGLAQSMTMLIAGRAIQGLGAGGLIPLAMAVIGDLIAPRERGKWQGLTGAVFGVASVVGPATGGWIADNTSWRWAFFVSLPFGVLALVVVWLGFRIEVPRREHTVDWLGAGLLAAGVTSALLAMVWGGVEYPWASVQIVGLFALAAVLLAGFVIQEGRSAEPILPLGLFRDRTIAAAQVALFFVGAAMFGTIMFIPLFVQGVIGDSAASSGAVLTPLMLALIGASVAAGQLVSRTGRYRGVLLSAPLVLLGGFLLLTRLDAASTSAEVTLDMVVVGLGLGLGMQTYVLVVQNAAPPRMMGVVTAATQFSRSVGGTIGVTAMGALLTARLGSGSVSSDVGAAGVGSPDALADAMHWVFVAGVPLIVLAFAATLLIEARELRRTVGSGPADAADTVYDELSSDFDDERERVVVVR